MIKLGVKAKDKITGFEGIVYGKAQYLTGCDQYCIQPQAKDGEWKDSVWIDEGRIEVLEPVISEKEVKAKENGGPRREAPTHR